jgi:hypothetical protein
MTIRSSVERIDLSYFFLEDGLLEDFNIKVHVGNCQFEHWPGPGEIYLSIVNTSSMRGNAFFHHAHECRVQAFSAPCGTVVIVRCYHADFVFCHSFRTKDLGRQFRYLFS